MAAAGSGDNARMSRVAVVGLGAMGSAIARRLLFLAASEPGAGYRPLLSQVGVDVVGLDARRIHLFQQPKHVVLIAIDELPVHEAFHVPSSLHRGRVVRNQQRATAADRRRANNAARRHVLQAAAVDPGPAGNTGAIPVTAPAGGVLEGGFTVNLDIGFAILDVQGTVIYNAGRVAGTQTFSTVARSSSGPVRLLQLRRQ